MVKGLIFILVVSLMTLTVGLSYKTQFDCTVMVMAEEEERSSEHSLDEIKIKLCSVRMYQSNFDNLLHDDSVNEKYTRPFRMFWSSANTNIHDIPPERIS